MFSRDADSQINARDQYCINEFLKSDKYFQIIRDSPSHGVYIPGGMWGIKKNIHISIEASFQKFRSLPFVSKNGMDQDFLSECIYHKVRDHAIIFDEFFNYKGEFPLKIPLPYHEYVGYRKYLYHIPV